jgi:hypothetical protein
VLLAGALVWTLTSASPEAQADINIQYDKTFSFAGLNTWAWHPDGAGDVRLAVSADDDPKRVAARVDPVIIPAVEKELATRKLTQAGAADAALYVHYYVLVTVGQSAQVMGQFVAPVPDWGLPPFSPSTTALTVYPVGTLLVDITARGREGIVWRGAAQRRVELEKTDAERRPVLERAIRDLFRNFPPRK